MGNRAPIRTLVRSVWDCFWNRFPGETLHDSFDDAKAVIRRWWTDPY
jgi:hypothetical protein